MARGRGAEPAGAAGDYEREDRNKKILEPLKFRMPVKAGSHLVQAYFVAKTSAVVEDLFDPSLRRDPYRAGGGEPKISSLTITGPLPETATVGESPSRARVLTCAPSSATDETCAKRIISTLARRAYRRPVTDADLQVPFDSYRDGMRKGGFEVGHRARDSQHPREPEVPVPVRERSPQAAAQSMRPIESATSSSRRGCRSSCGAASRTMSSSTWRRRRHLHRPEVLQQQVKRMLADPRSQALVENFAGQWLLIRNVAVHQPSPELLFHFDDNLRQAFERETQLFFESIMRENRSVVDLLDADYTFLNERLAKHYGIQGVLRRTHSGE